MVDGVVAVVRLSVAFYECPAPHALACTCEQWHPTQPHPDLAPTPVPNTGPPIRVERMQGSRGAVCPSRGHLLDTEDVDCDVCKCDLYLSAVVAPGSKRATCPEHAAAHGDALAEAVLLERLPLEELDALVADAVALVPGAQAAIEEAQQRKAKLAVRAVDTRGCCVGCWC